MWTLSIFQSRQKPLPRDDLIICDLVTYSDQSLQKYHFIIDVPEIAKLEAAFKFETCDDTTTRKMTINDHITISHTRVESIRVEMIQAAYN